MLHKLQAYDVEEETSRVIPGIDVELEIFCGKLCFAPIFPLKRRGKIVQHFGLHRFAYGC